MSARARAEWVATLTPFRPQLFSQGGIDIGELVAEPANWLARPGFLSQFFADLKNAGGLQFADGMDEAGVVLAVVAAAKAAPVVKVKKEDVITHE